MARRVRVEVEGGLYHVITRGVDRQDIFHSPEGLCSRGKSSGLVDAKEVLILSARRLGASLAEMSDLIGINPSTASRRYDNAKRRVAEDHHMSEVVANVIRQYTMHKA